MRMLDQNGTNSSALGPNTQLNQTLLGNHMQTNLSSGIGSSASSSQHHASGDRLDASSDSAVSSMGSERVASLSDGTKLEVTQLRNIIRKFKQNQNSF